MSTRPRVGGQASAFHVVAKPTSSYDASLVRRDPIPPELLADRPPGELWAPTGVPPSGPWALDQPTETAIGWLVVCPCDCCQGWCRLLPDPGDRFDYVLDLVNGCSRGCPPEELAWWRLWRLGQIPPREPLPADQRGQCYARGALRRVLGELPERPTLPELRRAAFAAGRWLAAGELPAAPVARALLAAADRAGLDPHTLASKLAADLSAGRARPGRLPS
jgi:hypothetical protein